MIFGLYPIALNSSANFFEVVVFPELEGPAINITFTFFYFAI